MLQLSWLSGLSERQPLLRAALPGASLVLHSLSIRFVVGRYTPCGERVGGRLWRQADEKTEVG
jgi:hypothetical protein